jgi:putative peptidoglycan lipid II flippase
MDASEAVPPDAPPRRDSASTARAGSLPQAAEHGPSSAALARSAGLVGLATMTSRLLGLVRDQVLAYLFGASNAMDAFNVAFRIPNLVRDLFAEGAMSAAFVPTFTRRLALEGRRAAWQLAHHVITGLVLATGTLVLLGIVFARPLIGWIAGEYAAVPGKLDLTVTLTRIMLPFLTLVAVAAAQMGMLNALQHFFLPALAPAMFNVATILAAAVLVPVMPALGHPPIVAIAVGALLGGFGQVAIQWPGLRREGYRYRPALDVRDPGLHEVLRLMAPATVGLAAVQINLLVNVSLATGEGTGAVSWINYAFRLMYLPIGLFGVSIATAALPTLAAQAARNEPEAVGRTLSRSLRLMLLLNVPAAVGLALLARPIVALVFERGSFTPADTAATAAALACYAPGLVGYSAVKIAAPSFYALGDSRTPVTVSVAAVALNVLLNLTLVRLLGYRGLALGTSIAALVNAAVLLGLLRRRLGTLDERRLAVAISKIGLASLAMGAAAVATESALAAQWPGTHLVARLGRVLGAIGVAVAVFAATARLLGIEEIDEVRRRLLGRIGSVRRGPAR